MVKYLEINVLGGLWVDDLYQPVFQVSPLLFNVLDFGGPWEPN